MPVTSVDEAYKELLSRIELNPARVALASQRYNAVKTALEAALPGKTLRQIGSFQRKTKIRPVDLSDRLDIDVVVSFGRFFQYAAPGIEGTVMPQKQDHPSLRIEYADQMTIEFVPAFEDLTGQHFHGPNGPNCYIVGSSPYLWIPADYDYDANYISAVNTLSDERLVPSIKMLKAYFRNVNVPLKSFHTEILVANIVPTLISDWKSKGYRFGYNHLLAAILGTVSNTIAVPATLPGSFSPPMNSGLDFATLTALGAFLKARADVAWQLCRADTVQGWREFFGDPFPS